MTFEVCYCVWILKVDERGKKSHQQHFKFVLQTLPTNSFFFFFLLATVLYLPVDGSPKLFDRRVRTDTVFSGGFPVTVVVVGRVPVTVYGRRPASAEDQFGRDIVAGHRRADHVTIVPDRPCGQRGSFAVAVGRESIHVGYRRAEQPDQNRNRGTSGGEQDYRCRYLGEAAPPTRRDGLSVVSGPTIKKK